MPAPRRPTDERRRKPARVKHVLMILLKGYRLMISPLYGDVCRYYPSCSAYALRAVEHHGAVKGSWYALLRLLRCHPWAPGGYDPVRGTPEFRDEMRELSMTEATMGGPLDHGSQQAPTGPGRRRPKPSRHGAEEEVVTVAQGRGVE